MKVELDLKEKSLQNALSREKDLQVKLEDLQQVDKVKIILLFHSECDISYGHFV